jgi:hypothetical protein
MGIKHGEVLNAEQNENIHDHATEDTRKLP